MAILFNAGLMQKIPHTILPLHLDCLNIIFRRAARMYGSIALVIPAIGFLLITIR